MQVGFGLAHFPVGVNIQRDDMGSMYPKRWDEMRWDQAANPGTKYSHDLDDNHCKSSSFA